MAEKIEKGIPVPVSKYAVLGRLRLGDSVVIDVPRSSSLSKTISVLQKKTGRKFKRQKVEGGVRVWRIDPTSTEPVVEDEGARTFEDAAESNGVRPESGFSEREYGRTLSGKP